MCNSHQIPQHIQPRMLKELLADDSYSNSLYFNNNKFTPKLLRTKSKAALTTIYALRKAFKYLQVSTIKSVSVSTKSIPNKCQNHAVEQVSSTVKVKDILRWRSFRDEKPLPLDFSSSPHRCTTVTTTTGTTSTGSNSRRSSWCDSDFTADESDLYSGNDCTEEGKSNQLCTDLEEEEEEEEEAKVALQRAKAVVDAVQVITSEFETDTSVDQLLFDFFRDELRDDYEVDGKVLRVAKNWASGENKECLEWKFGGSKELCMREMEWSNFEEEKQNLVIEIENEVLSSLMDQLLFDFC